MEIDVDIRLVKKIYKNKEIHNLLIACIGEFVAVNFGHKYLDRTLQLQRISYDGNSITLYDDSNKIKVFIMIDHIQSIGKARHSFIIIQMIPDQDLIKKQMEIF